VPHPERLVSESLHVIREARARYRRLAVLWSMGKDSTLLLGIRRDEHGFRAKERTFSLRTADVRWAVGGQPPELWDLDAAVADGGHARVHPLLHVTELDVWEATRAEGVPVNPLYFSRWGWRYWSLGCARALDPARGLLQPAGLPGCASDRDSVPPRGVRPSHPFRRGVRLRRRPDGPLAEGSGGRGEWPSRSTHR
jgi:hypothetical protein